jgi:hypothetical protein
VGTLFDTLEAMSVSPGSPAIQSTVCARQWLPGKLLVTTATGSVGWLVLYVTAKAALLCGGLSDVFCVWLAVWVLLCTGLLAVAPAMSYMGYQLCAVVPRLLLVCCM